ncbi:MAG TPA: GNAT family N-acetyltransferase [Candidatus Hydrogenedentes bacterium]|nr:GNAT family N-acetyltransferase [Candidatus Hydrogenedentota bacterium]HOL76845.1 GNAT family N-acetyltransferase [Candidatus Hydrogenedentota bacterium]
MGFEYDSLMGLASTQFMPERGVLLMEGPRPVRVEELPSLSELVDTVFTPGRRGEMFRWFPLFLSEYNAENLFVFVDQGRVVSHVGVALNRASIGGCAVGVACVGAVATYEEYRGRGLASELMHAAIRHADARGSDFMMISGGRGLYRRLGAADVGYEYRAEVGLDVANKMALDQVALLPCSEEDLDMCARCYNQKAAHFVRSPFEWSVFLNERVCGCSDIDMWRVDYRGIGCGYWVVRRECKEGRLEVMEFGGDAVALSASLFRLLSHYAADRASIHLQEHDKVLRMILLDAGAILADASASGTYLLLNFSRLMERLVPFFESRVGRKAAEQLRYAEQDDVYTIQCWEETLRIEGKTALMESLFGNRNRGNLGGVFDKLFPVPALWYGLNYV